MMQHLRLTLMLLLILAAFMFANCSSLCDCKTYSVFDGDVMYLTSHQEEIKLLSPTDYKIVKNTVKSRWLTYLNAVKIKNKDFVYQSVIPEIQGFFPNDKGVEDWIEIFEIVRDLFEKVSCEVYAIQRVKYIEETFILIFGGSIYD